MCASTRPTSARPITPTPATSSGLLCLKTAKSGGLSALVSSTTIFNEMRRRRPDLLKLLFQPVATDRRGEVPEGQKPYFQIPTFNWHKGFLTAIYQRQYINSAQRFADAPRLTPAHVEALDLFDSLANDPKLHMFMEFKPGDVQLVHNHTMLHDRTGFVDWPEPERRRHLLRLWLAASGRAAAARGLRPALRHGHGRRPRRHHRARHQAPCAAGGGLTPPAAGPRTEVDPGHGRP